MTSKNKLIKQGIKYTDSVFDEIARRLSNGVKVSDTLEDFLSRYDLYTTNDDGNNEGKNKPILLSEYKDKMLQLILAETNNHKFSRPSQKEMVRVVIENSVGDLIVDVSEDVQASVREIVKDGYNNELSQDEIAEQITNKVSSIKNRRARTIARTEIARTATISDYIISKERGATHFYVECRNTACPVCKQAWHEKWTLENDDNFNPRDKSAGGKGWIGDRVFSMNDVGDLPPKHPNCYHKDTQVFTNHGWKYFYDITENDKILSLNPQTNETEFLDYVNLIQVPNVHGKLYHIHNKWFDICVTPDHDCFIHQRVDRGKKGRLLEPQFRKPSDLTSESRFVRCIDTDRENPNVININGLELEPKDYAFFMAWFLSEGSVLHNRETASKHAYPIKITQEIGENREIIQPVLQKICDKLGLRLSIGKSYFEFYSKEFYDYLQPLGYSHEKYIPKEVFTLDKECLNIFLDNYVLGDGHERKPNKFNSSERTLYTSSPRLRDGLSYLILLCGYYPSIYVHTPKGTVTKHRNGEYVQKHDTWCIRVNTSQYTSYGSCTVDEIPYTDIVYCVELPKYHTLWIKRNGKTSWNGNCRCVAYFITEKDIDKDMVVVNDKTTTTTTITDDFLQDRLSEEDYKTYRMAKSNLNFSQSLLDGNRLDERGIQLHKQSIEFYTNQIKELEDKALSNQPKTKTVDNSVENNGYSLNNRENSYSNVNITKEQFDKVIQHQSTYVNANREYGNSIDNVTGELVYDKDIKGQKYKVSIPKHGKEYSIVHNHINNNGFSGGDAFGQTEGNSQRVCYATTPKGIWIMRDTEFGIFRKQSSVDGDYDLKSQLERKYKEFSNEGKAKYEEQYNNAKTSTEKRKVQRQMADEVTNNYNNWLLDEFAVGKNRANLIEIEFIPIEELNNVQF